MNGLNDAGGLLLAVEFAMLMKLMWNNKLAVFYLLGFVLTTYMKLPAVAVAAIGIVICVVVAQNDMRYNKLASEGVKSNHSSSAHESKEEEQDFFS